MTGQFTSEGNHNSMTNLLILHPDMSFGGTERQIANLVENLPRFGPYKIVVALYNCKGPLLEELAILSNIKIVDPLSQK